MKNVQIIDGATNCTFSIFQLEDAQFKCIFPQEGQDVEFIEDLQQRIPERELSDILDSLFNNPIRKRDALGIHGTLFFRLSRYKDFYSRKSEDSINPMYISQKQRRLFNIG